MLWDAWRICRDRLEDGAGIVFMRFFFTDWGSFGIRPRFPAVSNARLVKIERCGIIGNSLVTFHRVPSSGGDGAKILLRFFRDSLGILDQLKFFSSFKDSFRKILYVRGREGMRRESQEGGISGRRSLRPRPPLPGRDVTTWYNVISTVIIAAPAMTELCSSSRFK